MNESFKYYLNIASWILAIILFLFGMFFSVRGFATIPDFRLNAELTYEQRVEYFEKCEWHELKGNEAYSRAESLVWYMPESTDKEKAQACFTSAVAGAAAGTPQSRIVSIISTLFISYGLQCIEEYQKIQNYLKEAEYHFEMMEFYETVLVLG